LRAEALQRAGVQTGIQAWPGEVREQTLVVCVINPFTMFVIPAEAGIQKNISWMPHQVRHDMPTKSKEVLDALH
jgi:hypothetical protein